jgi:hypothetical protein
MTAVLQSGDTIAFNPLKKRNTFLARIDGDSFPALCRTLQSALCR